MESQSVLAKKKRGPAPTGKGQQVVVRLHPPLMKPLDAWIAAHPDPKPTRPEAIRRLLEKALLAGSSQSAAATVAKAEKIAAKPVPEKPSPARGEALLKKGLADVVLKKSKDKQ